jgi:hypothetical protein
VVMLADRSLEWYPWVNIRRIFAAESSAAAMPVSAGIETHFRAEESGKERGSQCWEYHQPPLTIWG